MEKVSRFRLSSSAFDRPEEKIRHAPKKVVFLSVEGDNTERDYFSHLNSFLDSSIIRIEVLRHKRGDGYSDPQYVVELLQESVNVREGEIIPDDLLKKMISEYSEETIVAYLHDPETVNRELQKKIKDSLFTLGIDIEYRQFLQSFGQEGDIFGVVLDRDCESHSRELLEACLAKCVDNGYKFYLSNPCFEFWLLLHLCDVKNEFSQEQLDGFRNNKKKSAHHTMVSIEVSNRAHHSKNIREKTFATVYHPNIHLAVERAKEFACGFPELFDEIGSNIPDLLDTIGFLE